MVTQSTLATRVPANIPGATIRSATDAWTTNLPPKRRTLTADLYFGDDDEGRTDYWRLTLACGHTADVGIEDATDYQRCEPCFAEGSK